MLSHAAIRERDLRNNSPKILHVGAATVHNSRGGWLDH